MSERSLDTWLRSIAFDILSLRDGTSGWKRHRDAFLRTARGVDTESAEQRLSRILRHAYKTSPYYRALWSSIGFDPYVSATAADLERLPMLTKDIIRERRDELVSEAVSRDQLQLSYTGGTTGVQTSFFLDRDCMIARVGRQWGILQQCGYRPGMRRALVWGVSSDLPAAGLQNGLKRRFRKYAEAQEVLCCTIMNPQLMRDYYQRLRAFKPQVLYGYPTALCELGRFIREQNLEPIVVQSILTTAERLSGRQRTFLEETFGGEVFNLYCTREYGCIGFECREHAGFHIDTDSVYLEITKDGRRQPPGHSGEITVTDLMNYGMPFIRSRCGDLGTLSEEPCACGSSLPLLTGLDGRTADLIRRPDGSTIAGIMLADLFIDLPVIRHAQFVQERLDELQVLVEVVDGYTRETEEAALAEVRTLAGDDMTIRIIPVEQIKRNERSGKYRDVISHLGAHDRPVQSADEAQYN